jgi:hypothetical protein
MSGADDGARRDVEQPRTPDGRGGAASGYGPMGTQRAPSPQQRGGGPCGHLWDAAHPGGRGDPEGHGAIP